jgi:hypothetical protein
VNELATKHKVIADVRPPDIVRLGLSPLTTRFTDVWDGLEKLGRGSEAGRELRELVSLRDKQPLSCCLLRATVVILDSLNTGVSQPGYYNFVFFLRDDVSRAETFCFLVFFVTVAFVPRSTW